MGDGWLAANGILSGTVFPLFESPWSTKIFLQTRNKVRSHQRPNRNTRVGNVGDSVASVVFGEIVSKKNSHAIRVTAPISISAAE